MNQDFAIETRLRQYLLDELGDEQRMQVEQSYFADDAAFERLLAAEDDLIDAYVGGELSAAERERFEHAFLTTAARRDRVAFARALQSAAAHDPTGRAATTPAAQISWLDAVVAWLRTGPATPRWAMAAAAVVLLVSGSWLALQRAQLQDAMTGLQAERTELIRRSQELRQRVEDERRRADASVAERRPATVIASFLLTPRLVRGGAEGNAVRIGSDTALLRLELELETDSHPHYQPVLLTSTGDEVWRQQAVPARSTGAAPGVIIDLPASLFTNRHYYILTLNGMTADGRSQEVAAYSFRVLRQ